MNLSIRELKMFNADVTQLEDTIALEAFAKALRDRYEAHAIEVPEWLSDALKRLTRAIDAQTTEARELRAKEIKAALDGLATRDEKKAKLQAELDKLQPQAAGEAVGTK